MPRLKASGPGAIKNKCVPDGEFEATFVTSCTRIETCWKLVTVRVDFQKGLLYSLDPDMSGPFKLAELDATVKYQSEANAAGDEEHDENAEVKLFHCNCKYEDECACKRKYLYFSWNSNRRLPGESPPAKKQRTTD